METVTISKDIELSPSSLHQGYFNDIYNNLCDKYRDTCTKDNGYIIDNLHGLLNFFEINLPPVVFPEALLPSEAILNLIFLFNFFNLF